MKTVISTFAICVFFSFTSLFGQEPAAQPAVPNVLWLTAEDIGPHLGCYGDAVAKTPVLDALSDKALTYDLAWSNYPVCAPARTTIITGLYASSHAAGHMRSSVPLDKDLKMFPQYLRERGYYCTNWSKEDYNLQKPGKVWDQSDKKANYSNRADKSQPFFAVMNQNCTHESKIRNKSHKLVTDPDTITVAPYYPDIPEVRRDWAQYYDNINKLDSWVGAELQRLEDSGQADNTIVVFFGDHGSGMPRHKRYAGDSGMRVPLIVYVPEKLKHLAPTEYEPGGRTDRPVGFVDLAPTMLSLAGIAPPEVMQGHAFMGEHQTAAPQYVYGYRSRMDERIDCSRSISDGRYVYIRNYMPHLPHGQFISYQQQTPTTAIWNQMYKEGKLNDVQSYFWQPRKFEELYDLESDPHETINLVPGPKGDIAKDTGQALNRLRKALNQQQALCDIEMCPEPITAQFTAEDSAVDLHSRLPETVAFAIQAANVNKLSVQELATALENQPANPTADQIAIRHWASVGILIRGEKAIAEHKSTLFPFLSDPIATVRINIAEALATYGDEEDLQRALPVLLEAADMTKSDYHSAIWALNAIARLGEKATPILGEIAALPKTPKTMKRGQDYVKRLIDDLTPRDQP